MPFRWSRSGQEVLPEVREWSGGTPVVPGVVGRPSQRVGMPFWRFEINQETLPEV